MMRGFSQKPRLRGGGAQGRVGLASLAGLGPRIGVRRLESHLYTGVSNTAYLFAGAPYRPLPSRPLAAPQSLPAKRRKTPGRSPAARQQLSSRCRSPAAPQTHPTKRRQTPPVRCALRRRPPTQYTPPSAPSLEPSEPPSTSRIRRPHGAVAADGRTGTAEPRPQRPCRGGVGGGLRAPRWAECYAARRVPPPGRSRPHC